MAMVCDDCGPAYERRAGTGKTAEKLDSCQLAAFGAGHRGWEKEWRLAPADD
jgi:hypothetical protein